MKIEMNIRKLFQRLCIPALALATCLASCTDELSSEVTPGGRGGTGEAEVTLKLQVPGAAAAAKTRATEAGTPKESSISDLYILAFKVDETVTPKIETLDYFVRATESRDNNLKWTASLKVKDYAQTFVMVANAQGTNSKVNAQITALAGNSVGQKKMDVLEKLTEKLSTTETTAGFDADNHPFTMYGQTDNVIILETNNNPLDVSMHRIVARVQVTFNEDVADKFEAKTVRLYNFNDLARVIPDGLAKTGQGYKDNPTIPDGATLFPKKASDNVPTYTAEAKDGKMVVKEKIYLFETAQPTKGTETENYLKRPCLIVGGEYKTEKPDGGVEAVTCYYRVDFAYENNNNKNYIDVIRNHTYNVEVTTVSGLGHDTPQEALESKPANITATVIDWADDPMENVEFDGKYALGVGTLKYTLGRRERNDLLQQVKASDGLEWTVTLCEIVHGAVEPTTQPDWISFVVDDKEEKTITRIGTGALQDLNFKVTKYEGDSERRAVMRFTAGRLKVDALVVQDTSNPVFLEVVNGNGETLKEVEFKQTPDNWCEDILIKYGPENTKLTWKFTGGGITLQKTAVDGTEQTGMEGEEQTDDQTSEGTLSLKALASALLDSREDFITKSGLLTITAEGKEGFKSHTVRLVQKKYGVSLVSDVVPCTGKTEYVQVIGNMEWKAVMDKTSADNVRHMLQYDHKEEYGIAKLEAYDGSRLSFATNLKPLNEPEVPATMKFTKKDDPDFKEITHDVKIIGCFVDESVTPNKYYSVYRRRVPFNMKDQPLDDVPRSRMADNELTMKIQNAAEKLNLGWSWQICEESKAVLAVWWDTANRDEPGALSKIPKSRHLDENTMYPIMKETNIRNQNICAFVYDVTTVKNANFSEDTPADARGRCYAEFRGSAAQMKLVWWEVNLTADGKMNVHSRGTYSPSPGVYPATQWIHVKYWWDQMDQSTNRPSIPQCANDRTEWAYWACWSDTDHAPEGAWLWMVSNMSKTCSESELKAMYEDKYKGLSNPYYAYYVVPLN